VYVHVISAVISVNGERLGDGATVKAEAVIKFSGHENGKALVFDLP
jgi:hypothetical protein